MKRGTLDRYRILLIRGESKEVVIPVEEYDRELGVPPSPHSSGETRRITVTAPDRLVFDPPEGMDSRVASFIQRHLVGRIIPRLDAEGNYDLSTQTKLQDVVRLLAEIGYTVESCQATAPPDYLPWLYRELGKANEIYDNVWRLQQGLPVSAAGLPPGYSTDRSAAA
jgi:hypothetical protein